jgi:predicted cupin superfamily sugar epimerase
MSTVNQIIENFQLQPHPEGGYFREVYRSEQVVASSTVGAERNTVTHIYFLLARGQLSRFHKVLHDEIWNVYAGSPIRLLRYDGNDVQEVVIGEGRDDFMAIIPGGVWQAAESTGDYTLVGCTVAPGFDFADFSFMSAEEGMAFAEQYTKYKKFV